MLTVIIPTYNASQYLDAQLTALRAQTIKDVDIRIIDSSSSDETVSIAKKHGVETLVIPKQEFDHGGTRTLAGKDCSTAEILVYLTQDAVPGDERSIELLIKPLYDPTCGATFGRQIPLPDATPFSRHARFFNYPPSSYIRTYEDRISLGIRAAFCSNSFAAYRREALDEVGWFAENLLVAEDMHVCARMLRKGFTLRYVAEAKVYHSHNYTVIQEFQRYFDLGVFFGREQWLLDEFGKPEGEGGRFLQSEWSFLFSQGLLYLFPVSVLRTAAKLLGYRLGLLHEFLPPWMLKNMSMHGISRSTV